jgi:tRNA (mo5U34)-methyltransferase
MALRSLVKVGGVGVALDVDDWLARRIRANVLWRGARDEAARVRTATVEQSAGNRVLAERIAAINWYHSIPLGGGLVTPGEFDHTPYLPQYPIPARLDGLRVLDVATFDGFWAFEFERRGAAEVVALDAACIGDCDVQPALRKQVNPSILAQRTGAGFALAKEALGSNVRREVLNVYDISPERLGRFDFVFCGDLLLHLMSPVRALERLHSVAGGEAMFVDCFSPHLPGKTAEYRGGVNRCVWWSVSLDCLHQMILDAGFGQAELVHKFKLGHRGEKPWMWRAAFRARA